MTCAHWLLTNLGQIGNWGSGGTPRSSEPSYYDGDIPWIRSGDLPDGRVTNHVVSITPAGLANSAARWIPEGALLTALYGATIGKVGITTYPVTTNQAVAFCIPDCTQTSVDFLFWYLLHIRPDLIALGKGGAQPNISQVILKTYPIALPPLSEQSRIVAKLDSLTGRSKTARDELAHIPNLIARCRQSVLAAACSGELTKDWRDLHRLPTPTYTTVRSVASDLSYGSSAKSAPAGKIPVLRMGNIQDGKLDWDSLVYTSDPSEIEKYRLVPGDILFNRTNSPELVGKSALYEGSRKAIFAGYLIRIRCSEQVLPLYLTYCLNSPDGRSYCWRVKTDGVSQSNINAKKLGEFSFLLPSLLEQGEIIRRVESYFAWLDNIMLEANRARDLLGRLDQSILKRAFCGELLATRLDRASEKLAAAE